MEFLKKLWDVVFFVLMAGLLFGVIFSCEIVVKHLDLVFIITLIALAFGAIWDYEKASRKRQRKRVDLEEELVIKLNSKKRK